MIIINLHHLRYFISVAENLNFTEAAKQLFVAQSAVSQQIAYLETQIGVELFTRTKRSVQLTSAGSVFLKEAIAIVKKTEEAVEKAIKAQSGSIGTLEIGFLAAPVRGFLPQLVKHFMSKYPHVELKLHHYTLGQLKEKLMTHEIDIAFVITLGFQDMEDLECTHFFSQSPCVYLHQEHRLAKQDKISIDQLTQESFVMRSREETPQWYDYTIALCAKHDFSPNIISQTPRNETMLMLVSIGVGIAILPNYLEMYANPTVQIIPIEGEENTLEVVAYRHIKNRNPTIPLFIHEMNEFITSGSEKFPSKS